MTDLFSPLTFRHGPPMKNRFMLAPLTNLQSEADGVLSQDEFTWLTYRAEGGFGMTMTCAAHVQRVGQGFPGQLGIFDEKHAPGLARLAAAIRAAGSVAVVQLHHAGMRSPRDLIGEAPLCPSADSETGARGLTLGEVEGVGQDFIAAALRAERAGFDGVELHGAHGYLLCQFLSPEINRRTDRYGGDLEGRARLLREIIHGIRARARPDFLLGVRLSPERFGLRLDEIVTLAGALMFEGGIDFLDLSLWDVFKEPVEQDRQGRTLLSYFADLPRHGVRVGAAGKIYSGADARAMMAAGLDCVVIGRSAILHHDFPDRVRADPDFVPIALPAPARHLAAERLGPAFLDYMRTWKGFVADEADCSPAGAGPG
jgi:2,4-dienoyl-CoA reductase-like NADH-dependent reductase (Old Yellow Enzyme family)